MVAGISSSGSANYWWQRSVMYSSSWDSNYSKYAMNVNNNGNPKNYNNANNTNNYVSP